MLIRLQKVPVLARCPQAGTLRREDDTDPRTACMAGCDAWRACIHAPRDGLMSGLGADGIDTTCIGYCVCLHAQSLDQPLKVDVIHQMRLVVEREP